MRKLIILLLICILFSCSDIENEGMKDQSLTVMFLGDSLTQHHDFQLDFPQHTIINEGVGGNKTQDLINRLDDILQYENIDIIILMIGVNDACSKTHLYTFIHNYMTIVNTIIIHMNVDVYCISILPTNFLPRNNIIRDYNYWIEQAYPDKYIPLYNYFLDRSDFLIKDDLTWDGVHLTALGYSTLIYLYNYFIEEL